MSIWRIVICLAVVGVAFVVRGKGEFERAAALETPPQLFTCRQLEETPQVETPNIVLSEFNSAGGAVRQMNRQGTAWEAVWVPAFPLYEKTVPDPEDYRVVLKVFASNDKELEEVLLKDTVEGEVWNRAQVLDPKARALLQQTYPGIQLDKCHLVEIGRGQASRDTAVTSWMIAAGCLVGAVGCSFVGYRRMQTAAGISVLEAKQFEEMPSDERFRADKF